MVTLNESALLTKLTDLNATQASIESVSMYCQMHRPSAGRVVALWQAEFNRSGAGKKLTLLYLGNDILQNSRKKGPEFMNEFFRVMPNALRHALKQGDDKLKRGAGRLISIWEERRVFGSSGSKSLRELVDASESTSPRKVRGADEALPDAGPSAKVARTSSGSKAGPPHPKFQMVEPLADALFAVRDNAGTSGRLQQDAERALQQVKDCHPFTRTSNRPRANHVALIVRTWALAAMSTAGMFEPL